MTAQAGQLLLFTTEELGETQEDVIARLLSEHGSPFGQWQHRLARFWRQDETTQAKARFLKGEFGTGGCGCEDVFARWDTKGMEIDYESPTLSFSRRLSWTEVARRYDAIIPTWEPFDRENALETENDMTTQCEAHGIERCATCGKAIEDGQEHYDIEGVERNCSEDCLNVALDSLYGVGRWQRHDIGTDVRYTALIKNEWRPLPVSLTATQGTLTL